MEIILANPRGFCAGVDRAISIVDRALDLFGAPIYVRHEVVHNKFVVDGLKIVAPFLLKNFMKFPTTALLFLAPMGFLKLCAMKLKNVI